MVRIIIPLGSLTNTKEEQTPVSPWEKLRKDSEITREKGEGNNATIVRVG